MWRSHVLDAWWAVNEHKSLASVQVAGRLKNSEPCRTSRHQCSPDVLLSVKRFGGAFLGSSATSGSFCGGVCGEASRASSTATASARLCACSSRLPKAMSTSSRAPSSASAQWTQLLGGALLGYQRLRHGACYSTRVLAPLITGGFRSSGQLHLNIREMVVSMRTTTCFRLAGCCTVAATALKPELGPSPACDVLTDAVMCGWHLCFGIR